MKGLSNGKMRVNVDRIPHEGFVLEVREPFESFPGLKALDREEVRFLAPIDIGLRVRRVSHFVEAAGSIQTSVALSCSRCLGNYTQSLMISFEATYTDEMSSADTDREDTDIELTAEDIDLFRLHGKEIDLSEAIQEHILLSLPIRPLCREDCKGLCPKCGLDLNQEECDCDGNAVDLRFAVLKNLKIDKA